MDKWEIDKMQRDMKSKDAIKEAMEVLIHEVNKMGNDNLVGQVVKEELANAHRTLQQGFFKDIIVPVILQFSEQKENGYFDLRNEDTCNCAEKLKPILEESYFRYI